MAQVFKFFCVAISVFLFLQLADADDSKETPKDGDNSLIPNVVQNNLTLPGKVAAQTSFNILSEPVEEIVSSIKDTYKGELAKSEKEENYVPIIGPYTKIANKPVAILKASKDLVGSTFGSMFGRAKSFWSSSKNDQAKKPEKEDK